MRAQTLRRIRRKSHRALVPAACSWIPVLALVGAAGCAAAAQGEPEPVLHSFDRTLLLETTSETSANVSFGDVNGDGTLDIVLAKGRHWPLVDRVLLGDGKGNITSAYDLGVASDRSYSGRLIDLDRDGDLDVVISNDKPDPKLVYLNDGHGTFRVGSSYGLPEWPMRNANVGDLNGDGLPDIVVANRSPKIGNFVCLNRGQGRFDDQCLNFSKEPSTTVTAADINRDGMLDLIVPYRDSGQSYVYLNSGDEPFSRKVPFGPADARMRMAEVADLDRDGLADIVAINGDRGVVVFFGKTDGRFSEGLPIGSGDETPQALILGDLNADGAIDIVVGHQEAPSVAYFNDSSGRRYVPVTFGDNKGAVYGFAIADFDGDGLPDIAAARSEAPNILYFAERQKKQ